MTNKHKLAWLLLMFHMGIFFGCTQAPPKETGKVIVRVGDYSLSQEEFQRRLAEELELDSQFKLTNEAKQKILDEFITRTLLVQEAKRRRLDQEETFLRSMERYWEATLLKNLVSLQGDELAKRITVSEEEIAARYAERKKEGESLSPLEEMTDSIRTELLEKKKTTSQEEWILSLRKKADITVNKELL